MLTFFKRSRQWDFAGGIHPAENKLQSSGTPLRQLPLADHFVIPLKQHIGNEGELRVQPGEYVLRGTPLTFGQDDMLPVHAPTSGTIEKIAPCINIDPSVAAEPAIYLKADGKDLWAEKRPLLDYRQCPREQLIQHLFDAGIAGLGGAGFPASLKLSKGQHKTKTLIINAAECEPYITADDRLMQEHADEIIEGCQILYWLLQADQVLIGIEDNKPEAIIALQQAINHCRYLQLRVIPTKYPSGGTRQLTKILTGREVPHGKHSAEIGVLMQNVGTVFAVKRAVIDGEALTERVVTLTGQAISQPGNVWARLGTPVSHLLQHAGFDHQQSGRVIMGGPLMGLTLPDLRIPVTKITNCLLAPSADEMPAPEEEKGCIRCSACSDVCPASLLPQQLYWFSKGQDHEKSQAYHINDCIECGACTWVCPSNIPLVQYYRDEKKALKALEKEASYTNEARLRFEARQERLLKEKQARETRHIQAKNQPSEQDKVAIQAALARVKAKQTQNQINITEHENSAADQNKLSTENHPSSVTSVPEQNTVADKTIDPRQATIAAAIERAKARKMATQNSTVEQNSKVEKNVDPRQAAITAAIERVKAKKMQQEKE